MVNDIDDARLARAASIYTVEYAKKQGIELHYVNTKNMADPVKGTPSPRTTMALTM